MFIQVPSLNNVENNDPSWNKTKKLESSVHNSCEPNPPRRQRHNKMLRHDSEGHFWYTFDGQLIYFIVTCIASFCLFTFFVGFVSVSSLIAWHALHRLSRSWKSWWAHWPNEDVCWARCTVVLLAGRWYAYRIAMYWEEGLPKSLDNCYLCWP